MLFNSISYLFFFPIVVFVTFFLPDKVRYLWLLAASYYFYINWNAKYGLLILCITGITFICGYAMESVKEKYQDRMHGQNLNGLLLGTGLLVCFGFLFYFKYTDFIVTNILHVFRAKITVPTWDIVLPVGISFFTFQAVGYLIDVYRGTICAERNPLRYALFISFFPQLVAGPIERSENLLRQLKEPVRFHVKNAKSGLLDLAYGLFLKIVLADNIASVVDPVFSDVSGSTGMQLLFANLLFAIQIYCDFDGYTQMAIGSAQILGFRLRQNFDAPYLACSIKDFWRRWHMSLTSWFRDYLYIPLGGGRKGTCRKQVNTMLVFLCSGLWHGAAWKYVVWGGMNGFYSIVEDLCLPYKNKVLVRLKINPEKTAYRLFQRCMTFLLVDVTWLFFRAGSLRQGFEILHKIISDFQLAWFLNLNWTMIASVRTLWIIFFSLLILLIADYIKYKGGENRNYIWPADCIPMDYLLAVLFDHNILGSVRRKQWTDCIYLFPVLKKI